MRQKRGHQEHENHERWLVSYADFITLLFAFFVVLYATSTQNVEKEKTFEKSVREQFKLATMGGQGPTQSVAQTTAIMDPINVFENKNVGSGELADYVEKLLQKNMTDEERKLAIGGMRHDSVGVRISLAASTFFASGSPKLRLPSLRSLDKIADILKQKNNRLIIEGHTDDQQIVGGQYDSNWELASLRATSVVRYLIKYHNIDPKRLAAISYADTKPLAPNTSDENRARNRRIEILIVNGSEEAVPEK